MSSENDLDLARINDLRVLDSTSFLIESTDTIAYIKNYFQIHQKFHPCKYNVGDREIIA